MSKTSNKDQRSSCANSNAVNNMCHIFLIQNTDNLFVSCVFELLCLVLRLNVDDS